jgi:hypothetical protein
MEMRLVALPLLVLALAAAAEATNYTVGDEKGWNPKVDYTAWVKKHRPFFKGDWLSKLPSSSSSCSSCCCFLHRSSKSPSEKPIEQIQVDLCLTCSPDDYYARAAVFEYQNGRSDVVQVNEVGYDNCDKEAALSSYSKGHTYAFQLKEAKDYYFICSYGYCYDGMKLHVTARSTGGSPSSSSSSGGSSSDDDSSSSDDDSSSDDGDGTPSPPAKKSKAKSSSAASPPSLLAAASATPYYAAAAAAAAAVLLNNRIML